MLLLYIQMNAGWHMMAEVIMYFLVLLFMPLCYNSLVYACSYTLIFLLE